MSIEHHSLLNLVFQGRKQCKKYNPIPNNIKEIAYSMFQENTNIDPENIRSIERKLNLPHNKLKDFFKNQRLKDFKSEKTFIKKWNYRKSFNKKDKEILMENFKKNSILSREILENLKKELSIKCHKKIRGWYDYRIRKMKNLASLCNENNVVAENKITKEKLNYTENYKSNSNFQNEIMHKGPYYPTPQLFSTLYMMPFYIFPIIFN